MTVYTYDAPQEDTSPTRATLPGRETVPGQGTSEETIPVRPVNEPAPGQPGTNPQPPAAPAGGSVRP